MFETLASFIIAGLLISCGYMLTRLSHSRETIMRWRELAFNLQDNIEAMQAEGCAAQGALEEIFNGVTAGGMPHSTLVKRIAEITAEALAEVPVCDHKAQAEEMVAARLNAEHWQNLAVESEARMEEAERLLGLANDRLIVLQSERENG